MNKQLAFFSLFFLMGLTANATGNASGNASGNTSIAGSISTNKPIIYCADASPEGFDPGLWDSASTSNVTNQMFQGLLTFKRGTTELVPQLAQSWTFSSDAKSLRFVLRDNVRFHQTPYFTPTRTLNADDVMFTFERMTNPQHVFNKAFPASFIYPQSLGLAAQISSIKKIDQRTVDFELKTANAAFLSYFAMAFSAIHSAEYAQQLLLKKRAADINNYPIGTGPYRFRSYKKDDVIRMEANPDYWRGPQITQKLIYSISREPNVRVQKLRLGECNITAPIRDVDITVLDGNPRVKVAKIQALNISYLSFNLRKAPTNNRLVREALDIAVDRDALFRVLFPRGDAMQAISAFPPSIPGYNKQLRNEYNPARARQLLASAGFKDNIELDLWALPVSRPTNPNGQLMAQMIQQDWAKIGVKAHIKTYEWGEYLKRAAKGEHDVYMSGWSGDSGDPDDFLATNLTCALNKNGVKFCNKEFDAMVEGGRSTTDPKRRAEYYEKAQVIFKYERPWMTMAHSTVYIPMSQKLEGFIMAPNGSVSFENVYVRP
ncbi:ABC transporter substrate-binding protein [Undibacterium seohonense]|jgi:peptide/nickel transport system substrate-binding protein/dipeptide transport system substrate-binding protein|nr:ABC transporter substrate-binding protein [Undibacterium seohonense]